MQQHTSMQSNQCTTSKLLPLVKGRNHATVTTASKQASCIEQPRTKNAHTHKRRDTTLHSKEYNHQAGGGPVKQEQPMQCVQSCAAHRRHTAALSARLWMKAAEDQEPVPIGSFEGPRYVAWQRSCAAACDKKTHRARVKAMPQKHDATWCRWKANSPTNSSLPQPPLHCTLVPSLPVRPNPRPPSSSPGAVNSTLRHTTVRGPAWQQGMGAVNALSETLTQNG